MKKAKPALTEYVYILSASGKPLMPTCRYAHVRRLLKEGKAKIVSHRPLVIQLLYETPEQTQELIMGIDAGAKKIAVVVRTINGQVVYAGELESRNREVTEKITERRRHRRGRRGYRRLRRQRRYCREKKNQKQFAGFAVKEYSIRGVEEKLACKGIKPKLIKFEHRKRAEGWLTPTARHLLASHENFVATVEKILPISGVKLEYAQFDIHQLVNPKVKGIQYQQGRMQGYANAREYVLYRDKHKCQLCGGENRALEAHHVIWREEGGADTPENIVTLCSSCHDSVHKNAEVNDQVKAIFEKMPKRFVPATLLNNIMERFYQWLTRRFEQVDKVYGYEVKNLRQKRSLAKDHSLDAYLASLIGDECAIVQWQDVTVYRYQQFRRHNRQLIHARRDRNYYDPGIKDGKKIIAKNRKSRCGQTSDSLADYMKNKDEKLVSNLRAAAGKKMIRRKCKGHSTKKKINSKREARQKLAAKQRKDGEQCNVFRPGDIVMRETGRVGIVTGSGHKGYSVVFYGEKGYEPARKCKLLRKNTGIVCVNCSAPGKK